MVKLFILVKYIVEKLYNIIVILCFNDIVYVVKSFFSDIVYISEIVHFSINNVRCLKLFRRSISDNATTMWREKATHFYNPIPMQRSLLYIG